MPNFSYTARKQDGSLVSGHIDAADPSSAAKLLMQQSIVPIDISAPSVKISDISAIDQIKQWTLSPVKLDDLVIFSRQMYSLTRSGIPLLRAIQGLAATTTRKRLADALFNILEELEKGRNLSSCMNFHPKIFDRMFVSIIHVGENTGRLDEAFLQLANYIEREQETRKQIKMATRYPSFVLLFIVLAIFIINYQVIPTFAGMFKKMGSDLPLMTQVLIGMSDFFVNSWYWVFGSIAAAILAVNRYLSTAAGRYSWDRMKLSLPIVGSIFERSLLSRFARSFGLMLSSGVPLTVALDLVAETANNAFFSKRVKEMRQTIEKGESLTRAANTSQLFSPLVMQMLSVGEETGRVDALLLDVAEYYDREIDFDLKSLTAKMEPILISVVAVMVLVLALGIFTPMWDMTNAYK